MTAIANWINRENNENPSVWSIGDSKVTNQGSGITLTLESSKVLELPIAVIDLGSHPEKRIPYFTSSIGFSYAGSTLVGLNCYATLSTMLSNLGGIQNAIPSLKDISITTAKVIDYYCKSICNKDNPFEAIVYGFCHINKRVERYHICKQEFNGEFNYTSEAIADETIFLLGDKKEEIYAQINADLNAIDDKQGFKFWRSPLTTISKITTSKKYDTIGGGTQLNIADKFGCKPYQNLGEKEGVDINFRNIDLDQDIGRQIGSCVISIPAMDYKMDWH